MIYLLAGIIGVVVGGGAMWLYRQQQIVILGQNFLSATRELEAAEGTIKTQALLKEEMTQTFKALLPEALHILQDQAGTQFESAGKLITSNLQGHKDAIGTSMSDIAKGLTDLVARTSTIDEGLKSNSEISNRLFESTNALKLILGSNQKRGQWGEEMVVDILNTLGMVEGINYEAQVSTDSENRPDFIFKLPDNKTINMDVKFPFSKYEDFMLAEDDTAREDAKKAFLKDVRNHIKTLDNRGYINTAQGTVDYLLLFIPNEAIYAFILEYDLEVNKFALEKGIVLCAPITLYAILSLIRQSIKSFAVQAQTGEILNLLQEFHIQWGKYVTVTDKMGEALDMAQKRFDELTSTRSNVLGRVVDKLTAWEKPDITIPVTQVYPLTMLEDSIVPVAPPVPVDYQPEGD